ncbi:Clp protease N-terminal domain-containing protein [Kribbella sindirgiensis]|uniref:Clp protease N-terminal domain-containing protein n=1 Tax=Kribbella sindirgiensis TaxID=1124744 RepID=UPI001EDE794D|nr:Clp protease N-terminal domain-containing protein [Kribbella sindirgiensis]
MRRAAGAIARDRNHDFIGTEHLLLAFYRDQAGIATKILLEQGLEESAAWTDVRAALEGFTK